MLRIFVLAFFLLPLSLSFGDPLLDRAIFQGKVRLEKRYVPYTLDVAYKPRSFNHKDNRLVRSITLVLANRRIEFPTSSLDDLWWVRHPHPVSGDYTDPSLVRVRLEGGDAGGSYEVVYSVSREGLVLREFYPHASNKPKVLRFDVRRNEVQQAQSPTKGSEKP